MRRILFTVLGLALACTILAACGSNTSGTGKAPKPAPTTTTKPSSTAVHETPR